MSLTEDEKREIVGMIPLLPAKAILGEGAFGKAVLIIYKDTMYVVKESIFKNDSYLNVFLNEVSILSYLSHSPAASYVPRFRGSLFTKNKGWIFMEFVYGATLDKVLDLIEMGKMKPTAEEYSILENGPQEAMNAIHKAMVLHLDIKPNNMYVECDPKTKHIKHISFIDFGFSLQTPPSLEAMGYPGGTPGFMTPKINTAFKKGTRVKYNRSNNQYALNRTVRNIKKLAQKDKLHREFVGILNEGVPSPVPRTASPVARVPSPLAMAPSPIPRPFLQRRPLAPIMPNPIPIKQNKYRGERRMVKGRMMEKNARGIWHLV